MFKTDEQLQEFEIIVNDLVADKDLEKALKRICKVYEAKRKKIKLNTDSIIDVQKQHSDTVEQLSPLLSDEPKEDEFSEISHGNNNEEIKIEIAQKDEEVNCLGFVNVLSLS